MSYLCRPVPSSAAGRRSVEGLAALNARLLEELPTFLTSTGRYASIITTSFENLQELYVTEVQELWVRPALRRVDFARGAR